MNLTDFTYAVGEFCLYYSTIGFVFQLFGCSGPVLWQAVLLLVSEALCAAASRARGPVRFLPLLILVPALLLGQSIGFALLGAPVAIVIFLRAKAHSFRADRETVRSLLLSGLGVYAILILTALMSRKTGLLLNASLPVFVVWLLCAVLCLRLLRVPDAELGLRYRLLNAVFLILIVLTGLVLSSGPVTAAVGASLKAVYLWFLAPVLFVALCLIAAIPAAIFYAIFWFIRLLGSGSSAESETQAVAEVQQVLQQTGVDTLLTPQWLIRCAVALGITLFLGIAYLFVRRLVSPGHHSSSAPGWMQRESVDDPDKPKARGSLFFSEPEDPVRRCYKKYLQICSHANLPADGSLASDALEEKAAEYTGKDEAEELRRLWLPVRYGKQASTPEERNKARAALAAIRAKADQSAKKSSFQIR